MRFRSLMLCAAVGAAICSAVLEVDAQDCNNTGTWNMSCQPAECTQVGTCSGPMGEQWHVYKACEDLQGSYCTGLDAGCHCTYTTLTCPKRQDCSPVERCATWSASGCGAIYEAITVPCQQGGCG